MTKTIPGVEPVEERAGENWDWDRTISDFPPSEGWALKYALRGPTDADFTAGTNGETYELRIGPDVTGAREAGTYRLIGYVEKGAPVTDREVVYEGTLRVEASPLTAVNAKSHAETVYGLVTAQLEGRLPKDREEFTINGRRITHIPIAELLRLKNYYGEQLRLERHPGRLSPGVEVRFVQA